MDKADEIVRVLREAMDEQVKTPKKKAAQSVQGRSKKNLRNRRKFHILIVKISRKF
jgi:hypothetical protein